MKSKPVGLLDRFRDADWETSEACAACQMVQFWGSSKLQALLREHGQVLMEEYVSWLFIAVASWGLGEQLLYARSSERGDAG